MIRPHMRNAGFILAGILSLFLAGIIPSQAAPRTWVPTTGINDWFNPANWDGGTSIPGAGDAVTIATAGAALLTNSPGVYFSSLTLSKTLIFSNWNTTLSATNITIQSGGTVTLPLAFTNNQMSNNVYFVCSNLTVDAGGNINVDARGWSGGAIAIGNGYGPGRGLANAGGGGYGGWGGGSDGTTWGITYGSETAPLDPGSGGAGSSYQNSPGRNGGGAIRIEATGAVTVNGTISANGQDTAGWGTGAGSGGSVYLTCNTFLGSGLVQANGGYGYSDGDGYLGGGGRIAVIYNKNAQAGVTPAPTVQFSSSPGVNGRTGARGGATADLGTLYFSDTQLIGLSIPHNGKLIAGNWTNWSPASLTITNAWVRFPNPGFQLTVSNNLTITGSGARLELGGNRLRIVGSIYHIYTETNGPTLTCGGNLILTNSSRLWIYSGMAARSNSGARVTVAGNVVLATNCWIYPISHPTNGGSVYFQMRNLTILTPNAGFNANSIDNGVNNICAGYTCGYFVPTDGQVGYGPGGGNAAGGSYGGRGAGVNFYGAATYGSSNAPVEPGSGGCSGYSKHWQGSAGGLIRLDVTDVLTLNGSLTANGAYAANWSAGGGSGGGIYVTCRRFAGAGGILSAVGGIGGSDGTGGGGGGGRIAVWRITDQSSGTTATVAGGAGTSGSYYSGEVGTIVWGWLPAPGTVFAIH